MFEQVMNELREASYKDLVKGRYFKSMILLILEHTTIKETDQVPTASVSVDPDTYKLLIKYNPEYAETSDMLKLMLMHEAAHILFKHMDIDKSAYDKRLLNVALDAQINSYIVEEMEGEFTDLVSPILKPEEGKGFSGVSEIHQHDSWESLYIIAKENLKNQNNDETSVYMTEEEEEEKEQEKNKEEEENGNSQSNSSGTQNSQSNGSDKGKAQKKYNPLADNHDSFTEMPETSKIETGQWIDKIVETIEDVVKKPGAVSGQLNIPVTPKNPTMKQRTKWEKELSKYVGGCYNKSTSTFNTWSRPNRRFGEHLPGKTRENFQSCGLVVDVSGSMSSIVPVVLGYVSKITTFIGGIEHLVLWDTVCHGEYRKVSHHKLKKIEITGYGGTCLSGGIEKVASSNSQLIVILTDMCVPENDFQTINKISKTGKQVIIGCIGDRVDLSALDKKVKVIYLE